VERASTSARQAQAQADLLDHGLCLLTGVLDDATIARARSAMYDSRVWHRTGANTSATARRAAVFAFYTTPVYRTQENWFLSLSPAVVRQASDTLLTLHAYRSEGFGLVYGRSPHESLDQPR
jgi:ectoine hydroxylase-related dioxygenase (phytanoyl-CoA dioxygenase family)